MHGTALAASAFMNFRIMVFTAISLFASLPMAHGGSSTVFERTLASCRAMSASHPALGLIKIKMIGTEQQNHVIFMSARETWSALSFDPATLADIATDRRWLSDETTRLLSHPDFESALDRCFGNNPVLKLTYTHSIVLADVKGKLLGNALAGGMVVGFGKAMNIIAKTSPRVAKLLHATMSFAVYAYAVYVLHDLYQFHAGTSSPEERREAEIKLKSLETALNESTDQLIQATIDILEAERMKADQELHFLQGCLSCGARQELLQVKINKIDDHLRRLTKEVTL